MSLQFWASHFSCSITEHSTPIFPNITDLRRLSTPPLASPCPWQHSRLVLILPSECFADLVMSYYYCQSKMSFSSHWTVLSVQSRAGSIRGSSQPIWAPMKPSNGVISADWLVPHMGTFIFAQHKLHVHVVGKKRFRKNLFCMFRVFRGKRKCRASK